MNQVYINGVSVEKMKGNYYQAYQNGLCSYGRTLMMAYIRLLKHKANQEASDLDDCYTALSVDRYRMEVNQ